MSRTGQSAAGAAGGKVRLSAPSKRVAKAAAKALVAANTKRGVPSDAKTRRLAAS
jgi:hypothetical protein